MLPESIIFDVDGTLWDTVALVAKGWNMGLRELGLAQTYTGEEIRPLFGRTMDQIAGVLMPGVPAELHDVYMQTLMRWEEQVLAEDPCHVFYPDVLSTIPALAKEHRLLIVSNCQKGYIELTMKKGNFAPYIRDHACFGDTGMCKGETIRRLMERNQVADAAYVGDTQGDLEAAMYAGIPFIWAAYGFGMPQSWAKKIDRFGQLLAL